MPSTRPVTAPQAFLWFVLLAVLVGLFLTAVSYKVPPSLIVIVAFGLSRLLRADRDEPPDRPIRPAIRRGNWTPVRPQAVDRDHPMFDRDLDS